MNLDPAMAALARVSLEAGVLVLVIFAAQTVFGRWMAPRWRCALWLLLAVRLLLPFAPACRFSLFNLIPESRSGTVGVIGIPDQREEPMAIQTAPSIPASSAPLQTERRPSRYPAWINSEQIWVMLWLAGFCAVAIQIMLSARLWSQRLASSKPITDPEVLALVRACSQQLGLRIPPSVYESVVVPTPILYGLLRPRIVLPSGFLRRFSTEETGMVLLHELAHLKRGDLALNWVIALLQAVHWFNPLVWLGFAKWRVDREVACDAAVLEAAGYGSSRSYGEVLIQLLEGRPHSTAIVAGAGILEAPRSLKSRLAKIMAFRPATRWSAAAILLFGAIGVGCLTDRSVRHMAEALTATTQVATAAPALPAPTAPKSAILSPQPPPSLGRPTPAAARIAGQPAAKPATVRALAENSPPPRIAPARPQVVRAVAKSSPLPTLQAPPAASAPVVPTGQKADPLFVGGIDGTWIPRDLSPAGYQKVLNLKDTLTLTDLQVYEIGTVYTKEIADIGALGSHPPASVVNGLRKQAMAKARGFLDREQRLRFNLIPEKFGGGLYGFNPWSRLNQLNRAVHLSEQQRGPVLQVYINAAERLMECQGPQEARAIRSDMTGRIRSLLSDEQRSLLGAASHSSST